ncbi:pilus assembly protein TadG-related protein [Streptomyces pathocidini]|uniref:pilus assembly protein TadG-related protein n=1 Tax=Streptomyces pathocidini TaxID=1650571 RepID=UPI003F4D4E29
MTAFSRLDDRGQAFPIYITAVGALLFLAFAFFAVGQAAASRNSAQTAADAAALALAQDARDQLRTGLLDAVGSGGELADWLGLDGPIDGADCAVADDFAGRNGAVVTRCEPGTVFDPEYTVEVRTREPIGNSVIPGTESEYATADATAVIEPRCWLAPGDEGGGRGRDPVNLECDDRDWSLDPDNGDSLPEASDLFSVHLSE